MSWNPVLDFFVEVKNNFIKTCGKDKLWNYGYNYNDFDNCLSYWVWTLGNHGHRKRHYYNDVIKSLWLNESMGMLLIKYNDLDIDWDAHDGFYRECRSVVINVLDNELILTPFRKFFNINEREETQLHIIQEKIENAAKVEITDKLDGSMCSCRWYRGEVIISGSQALDMSKSFRLGNYFHWMQENQNAVQMLKDYRDCTFIFEGIFPNDVHVVQYDEQMFGLHLIGIRRVPDGIELSYQAVVDIAEYYGVPHVKIFNMTFEEAYTDAQNNGRMANEGEGYVIDIDGQKYKCKYNDYVMMHHALCKMISPNAIIAAIHENRWDDFYSKIPLAYQPQARVIADDVFTYLHLLDERVCYWWDKVSEYCDYNPNPDRKFFMIGVNEIVPKRYQGAVRSKYLMKDIDYLRGVKYGDIQDYIELMQALTLKIKA